MLDAVTRLDFARQLKKLRQDEQELLKKQQESSLVVFTKKDVEEYVNILNRLPEMWKQLSFEQKRKVIELLVENVVIKKLSPHWFGIQIEWKGFYGRVDLGYIWRATGRHGSLWSAEELKQLRPLYATEHRSALMEMFPDRPWSSIKLAGQSLGISRNKGIVEEEPTPISYSNHVALTDQPIMELLGLKESPTGIITTFWTEASPLNGGISSTFTLFSKQIR